MKSSLPAYPTGAADGAPPFPGMDTRTRRSMGSESIEISGVRVTLSDTAGLRHTDDPVEALGVERSEEAMRV